MECHIGHFLCIVFIVFICAPLTLGFWTTETGLPIPNHGEKMTCVGWITFYGFKDDDFEYNNEKAKNRHAYLDKNASTWAAMYAYELSGSFHEDKAEFLPQIFCKQHDALDNEYRFLQLKDESRTCEDWLFLYGYTDDVENNNKPKALARNESLDQHISLWPDGYGRALSCVPWGFYIDMSPTNYCLEMGQTEVSLTQFINRQNIRLTCERWIQLYGYTSSAENNYHKAYIDYPKPLMPFRFIMPLYVRIYSQNLQNRSLRDAVTPKRFCRKNGYRDDEIDFFEPVNPKFLTSQGYSSFQHN